MLRSNGHAVVEYTEDNRGLDGMSTHTAAARSVWSRASNRRLRELLASHKPDVVHFHNPFPLVSPAAYWACSDTGVPVVQTLHNYRLLCPAATFFRDGRICEDCLGKTVTWPGVLHACYRGARAQSAVVTSMPGTHRLLGTWTMKVAVYVALTELAREAFIAGEPPADKIMVKPNSIEPDPGVGDVNDGYAIFVGCMSEEKGVRSLLAAWRQLNGISLKIVGDGPLINEARAAASADPSNGMEIMGLAPAGRGAELDGERPVTHQRSSLGASRAPTIHHQTRSPSWPIRSSTRQLNPCRIEDEGRS